MQRRENPRQGYQQKIEDRKDPPRNRVWKEQRYRRERQVGTVQINNDKINTESLNEYLKENVPTSSSGLELYTKSSRQCKQ